MTLGPPLPQELSYYAISSHFNDQNSRKPDIRGVLSIFTPSLYEKRGFKGFLRPVTQSSYMQN